MINSPRVCIQVQSVYIEAQSSPDNERFCLYRNHTQSGASASAVVGALLADHQWQWP